MSNILNEQSILSVLVVVSLMFNLLSRGGRKSNKMEKIICVVHVFFSKETWVK